mgnify:CR=1 FL=1
MTCNMFNLQYCFHRKRFIIGNTLSWKYDTAIYGNDRADIKNIITLYAFMIKIIYISCTEFDDCNPLRINGKIHRIKY